MVMTHSLVRHLRQLYPDAFIDIVAPEWCLPVALKMQEVRACLLLPYKHGRFSFRETREFATYIKSRDYDWCLLVPNSLKSAILPFLARVPKRTGWLGEMRYGLLNDCRALPQSQLPLQALRFASLANIREILSVDQLLRPVLTTDPVEVASVRETFGLVGGRPVIILCPGAEYGESKRWPSIHFATLAELLIEAGFQVWLMASAKEQSLGQDVTQRLSSAHVAFCVNLAGKTSLAEAIALMKSASCVVANDSGMMHVASALSVPVVAIYGSTASSFAPPLTEKKAIFYLGLHCSPCLSRTCLRGDLKCLYDIRPQSVFSAILSFQLIPK